MQTKAPNLKTGPSKQVAQTSARRSVFRSSSMQVEDGNEKRPGTETSSKSCDKWPSNGSYNMERWLSQKPSEESWYSGK